MRVKRIACGVLLLITLNPSGIANGYGAADADAFASQPAIVASSTTVTFYGDSRAWYLAQGTELDPQAVVDNEGRQGCSFLGQSTFFQRYNKSSPPAERSISTQTTGEVVACDTRAYISAAPGAGQRDLAVVLAGTLLTVDIGTEAEIMFSPLDPSWQIYLENNLVETFQRIALTHERIVVLDTPVSLAGWARDSDGSLWPNQERVSAAASAGWLWADEERIAAVDAILVRAANRVGAIYISGFARWVDSQPASCQPDGSHFAIECAAQAWQWVKHNLHRSEFEGSHRLRAARLTAFYG
ncbi:MAG: hypothetical protein ABL953_06960 [Ilumatobacteraceae bacterium]